MARRRCYPTRAVRFAVPTIRPRRVSPAGRSGLTPHLHGRRWTSTPRFASRVGRGRNPARAVPRFGRFWIAGWRASGQPRHPRLSRSVATAAHLPLACCVLWGWCDPIPPSTLSRGGRRLRAGLDTGCRPRLHRLLHGFPAVRCFCSAAPVGLPVRRVAGHPSTSVQQRGRAPITCVACPSTPPLQARPARWRGAGALPMPDAVRSRLGVTSFPAFPVPARHSPPSACCGCRSF